jgi:hypothetical protein
MRRERVAVFPPKSFFRTEQREAPLLRHEDAQSWWAPTRAREIFGEVPRLVKTAEIYRWFETRGIGA